MIIKVQNGQLPQGFCPPDYQTLLNGFSNVQFVDISSISSIIVSSTPPGASDHDKAWLQLDSNGRPVRLYFFASGAWLSQHPFSPGFTIIWNQALPNFQTFDGGDASAPPFGDLSGQMWQLMSTTLDGLGTQVMQAEFPVGVGAFAKRGNVLVGADNITDTGNVGEDQHLLITDELAKHRHFEFNTFTGDVDSGPNIDSTNFANRSSLHASFSTEYRITGGPTTEPTAGQSSITGNDVAHNNLPPFYGVYFLQRTNKRFYVV